MRLYAGVLVEMANEMLMCLRRGDNGETCGDGGCAAAVRLRVKMNIGVGRGRAISEAASIKRRPVSIRHEGGIASSSSGRGRPVKPGSARHGGNQRNMPLPVLVA